MSDKIVFYVSLAYNLILNRINLRKWYHRIDQHVLLGALPMKGKFPTMLIQKENVRAVISMNRDFELDFAGMNTQEWNKMGIEFLQLPTKDFGVPSLPNLQKGVQMIESVIDRYRSPDSIVNDQKPSIYIHCKAGRTRSSTLVACYLVKTYDMTPQEAVIFIREKRSHIDLKKSHIEMIQKYRDSLKL
ncbi:T-complex protein 1 subunit gamma [Sarcoptes scabiei]|uniref:Phosphatidylglycerophosphatase and protein-tyrosine phosphatase 1 n=1 Tax=Sarcoptes scabiei TaxID=52283 RepID=A0A131ZSR5_SARSC|nr:protein-tyrosine phosphatase mitochondrial 1-like protein [Sarcoptes scabiei]UXI16291.1 T-complex protein 1 subunit gamma [Sarcoptes scabiei]